jgi:hypothetical protein
VSKGVSSWILIGKLKVEAHLADRLKGVTHILYCRLRRKTGIRYNVTREDVERSRVAGDRSAGPVGRLEPDDYLVKW